MSSQFKGAAEHLRKLKRMPRTGRKEAEKLVYTLADIHVTEAANLITTGGAFGAAHVVSKPYEPPNADTGDLDRSGHVRSKGPLAAESVFDMFYAADLEFGNDRVIERPFSRPAARTTRKRIPRLAKFAVRTIVKGGSL